MAISAGDLVKMRGVGQTCVPHLNVVPLVEVATCRVNDATMPNPMTYFHVDGISLNGGLSSLSDVPKGSMFWVGKTAGAHDVMVAAANQCMSTAIWPTRTSLGDPGVAVLDAEAMDDDQYVTLYANKPLWGCLSYIKGGGIYKTYHATHSYSDQNEDPPPICNIGPWRRAKVDSGGTAEVSFTNAADGTKPASFAWGSKTISSYSWTWRNSSYTLTTGGTVTAGSTASAGLTIEFDPGFYIVYCAITDSGGKTHTAEVPIWIIDDSTESDLSGWRIERDTQDRQGRRMTVALDGDVAESVVYPGAAFLYTETQTFAGDAIDDDATVHTFVGYIDREKGIREVSYGKVEFDLISPSLVLDQLPMASQYIIEVASPDCWTEVTDDLSHPNGIVYYVLQWHAPSFFKQFDFSILGDEDLRDHIWTLKAKSVWGQLQEMAGGRLIVGSTSAGMLCLRHDPMLMSSADRAALDTQMTWAAGDLSGDDPLEYPTAYRLKTGLVDAYAFSYDGTTVTPYWSRAPGDAQAQGKSKERTEGMNVSVAGGQAELNRLAGHLFAKKNNPTPQLILNAFRNMDTADPALMIWHKLTISDALDPRGSGYTDRRFLPLQVNRSWRQTDGGTWLKELSITVEAEASGEPGIFKAIPVSQEAQWMPTYDWPGLFGWGDPENLEDFTVGGIPIRIIAWSYSGPYAAITVTSDDWASTASWTDISTGLSGNVRWATGDPWQANRYFCVTEDGLFRCEDVLSDSPVWTQILDNSRLPSGSYYHNVTMSINRQGWIMLMSGKWIIEVSFDYGATWHNTSPVNPNTGDMTGDWWQTAQVSPYSTEDDNVVFLHQDERLYVSSDWGLTWTQRIDLCNAGSGWGINRNGCGTLLIPFKMPGSTANDDHTDQHIFAQIGERGLGIEQAWFIYSDGNGVYDSWYRLRGGYVDSVDTIGWPSPSLRNFVVNTLDGDEIAWLSRDTVFPNPLNNVDLWYLEDGQSGSGWDEDNNWIEASNHPYPTASGGGMSAVGMNGWPYNANVLLVWGRHSTVPANSILKLTLDKGDTAWKDVYGNLISGGIFGDKEIAYAEAVLVTS